MFGLTFEKLVVAAVIAAVLLGPTRLPLYAHKLAGFVRALRSFTDTARRHAESETGISMQREDWHALDPRQYDPRRIMRETLEGGTTDAAPAASDVNSALATPDSELATPACASVPEEPARQVEYQYIVTGSSAHPRRTRVPIDPSVE